MRAVAVSDVTVTSKLVYYLTIFGHDMTWHGPIILSHCPPIGHAHFNLVALHLLLVVHSGFRVRLRKDREGMYGWIILIAPRPYVCSEAFECGLFCKRGTVIGEFTKKHWLKDEAANCIESDCSCMQTVSKLFRNALSVNDLFVWTVFLNNYTCIQLVYNRAHIYN